MFILLIIINVFKKHSLFISKLINNILNILLLPKI